LAKPRETKDRIFEQFARIGQAMASPKRLELLDLLCQAEKTVEMLAAQASLNVANASRHLQILRAARLVDARRDGTHVYYRLADDDVCSFFHGLRKLASARLAEMDFIVEEYFDRPQRLKPIDRRKLIKKARAGEIIILDVRPKEEFLAGHLPLAHSIPFSELKDRLDQLPADAEVVAYCRGPYCVLAQEAVRIMRAKGRKAVRLEDGVMEWREAGMAVEK